MRIHPAAQGRGCRHINRQRRGPGSSAKSLPALVGGEVDYVIVSNGGETYDAQGGGWAEVSSFCMADEDVSSIVARLEERL